MGESVGAEVGDVEGELVGRRVGDVEGDFVGAKVGELEGALVGALVGDFVGAFVGVFVGALGGTGVGGEATGGSVVGTGHFFLRRLRSTRAMKVLSAPPSAINTRSSLNMRAHFFFFLRRSSRPSDLTRSEAPSLESPFPRVPRSCASYSYSYSPTSATAA